jgi:hypothetical protein
MRGDLVPECRKRGGGELLGLALDLLHGEHVHLGALKPIGHPVDAGPYRVHIPGGEAHGTTVPT